MGDTSLLQLRDAIDVIIGKLDDKIVETSKRDSLKSITAEVINPPKKALRRCKKERAISNDFLSTNTKMSSFPKGLLLQQLGLKSSHQVEDRIGLQTSADQDRRNDSPPGAL